MPNHQRFVGPEDVPEAVFLKQIAVITAVRGSNCSYWMAADPEGQPDGTYMILCVLGPKYIADTQAALKSLMEKWDEDEAAQEGV